MHAQLPLPRHFAAIQVFYHRRCLYFDDALGNRMDWLPSELSAKKACHLGRCLLNHSGDLVSEDNCGCCDRCDIEARL